MKDEQLEQYEGKSLIEALGTESIEIKKWDEIITPNTISYPVVDFVALGNSFSRVSAGFSALSAIAKSSGKLYEASFPVHGHLAAAKDGSGLLGTIINEKGIAGQARFTEVGDITKTAGELSNVFMAMALMAINKSLQTIEDNQKAIIDFLETDKQTQLKGDLNVLTEVINDYQYNWENSQWLSNRETQILDIKRSSEQNILFYREMIEKKLASKKQLIRFDVSKSLNEIQNRLKYYKLALYLFSFSSFMGIMLLKNFDSNYLDAIKNRIRSYADDFDSFYERSVEGVGKIAEASLQSRTFQGLSTASKFIGNQIAKIPDKNNKIKVDDKLISGSDKLKEKNEKTIADTKDVFLSAQDNGIKLFEDKINMINRIYNEPLKLYFDEEKLYFNNN